MSEYQDHIRQTLDGMDPEAHEEFSADEMRWTPAPDSAAPLRAAVTAAQAHALLDLATDAYLAVVNLLEDGTHHMVGCANTPDRTLTEGHELTVFGEIVTLDQDEALRLTVVLAAALVECSTGALVVRTFAPDGSEWVRGWTVRNRWLRPLTAQEIQRAYSTDPTGTPLPPEPGLEYRQAERVSRPETEAETRTVSARSTAPRDNRPPNRRN
ncbi:hypothetical protein ACFWPQ_40715 [Streptomyces sp. NPDC058464]|uniref:hypothetical protein n=1 Tax=Streptomyces sp. NPDC058464 TaxID=3346511 RepID=UPI003651867E